MSRLLVAFLTLALGSLAAADDPAEKAGDLAKMKGTWKTFAGPNKDVPITLKIDGNSAIATFSTPEGETVTIKGEIKVNDAATPKTIDFINFKRPNDEDAGDNLGIYELKDNELRICNGGPGEERPKEFKDGDDGKPSIHILTREPDDKK
jgi:uncharacterized protein (TIGR03067 family)